MKSYLLITTLIIGINQASFSQSLDSLINYALTISPELNMLKASLNAIENRIPQESNLDNPTLSLGFVSLPTTSFRFDDDIMTGKVIGIEQKIPFPGKLGTKEEAINLEAEIKKEEIKDAANEIKMEFEKYYAELSITRKKIKLAEEIKDMMIQAKEVVKTKYETATASQQHLINIHLQITQILDDLERLKSDEGIFAAKLNSMLLNRINKPFAIVEPIHTHFVELDYSKLDSLAEANRPYLLGILAAKKRAAVYQELASYNYYPDFSLSFNYMQRDRLARTNMDLGDMIAFGINISLPLSYGGKNRASVEEWIAYENHYNYQYSFAKQILSYEIQSLITELKSIEERIKLIREIKLPQANQNHSSALASYQVGEIDYINVVEAIKTLYEININLLELNVKYHHKLIKLEFLIGTNLR